MTFSFTYFFALGEQEQRQCSAIYLLHNYTVGGKVAL